MKQIPPKIIVAPWFPLSEVTWANQDLGQLRHLLLIILLLNQVLLSYYYIKYYYSYLLNQVLAFKNVYLYVLYDFLNPMHLMTTRLLNNTC